MSIIYATNESYGLAFNINTLSDYEELIDQGGFDRERFKDVFSLALLENDQAEAELFHVCMSKGCPIELWLEEIEPLSDHDKAALFYLMTDCHYAVADAMGKVGDMQVFPKELEKAAEEIFQEVIEDRVPEDLMAYMDHQKFADALRMGGDLREFHFAGQVWTITNH